ncbi:hypothetical protein CC78DRAFT_471179, partial [Lojkania enalia]
VESHRPGYPRLAAFLNSDRYFCAFKSFGRLHARVLLDKQDELIEIQEQLEEIDQAETTSYFLHTRREDRNSRRREILLQIGHKLIEYNALLRDYYSHLEQRKPQRTHVESISNWLHGNKPLVAEESVFLEDWEDLSSPNHPVDHGGLERFLERCALQLDKIGSQKSTDNHVLHFSPQCIAAVSRGITTILAVATLTVPIAVLYSIPKMTSRLWAITIFTGIFSGALCMTHTRNFEIFSATAAYCAVMVVFVANLPI